MISKLAKIIDSSNFIIQSYDVCFYNIDNTNFAIVQCEIDLFASKSYLIISRDEIFTPKDYFKLDGYLPSYCKTTHRGPAIVIINLNNGVIMQTYFIVDTYNGISNSNCISMYEHYSFIIFEYFEHAYLLRLPSLDIIQLSGINTISYKNFILTCPVYIYDEEYNDFTLYDVRNGFVYDLTAFFPCDDKYYSEYHFYFKECDRNEIFLVASKNNELPIVVNVNKILEQPCRKIEDVSTLHFRTFKQS